MIICLPILYRGSAGSGAARSPSGGFPWRLSVYPYRIIRENRSAMNLIRTASHSPPFSVDSLRSILPGL